jgi:hypothetical protein
MSHFLYTLKFLQKIHLVQNDYLLYAYPTIYIMKETKTNNIFK